MPRDRDLTAILATIMPRPLILGHRGSPDHAPENTLRGFQAALEQGADGIELDVQISSDGVPVVIHDPVLDRMTSRRGRVDHHSWAELQSVRVGDEDPLPSLEQVAVWAASSAAFLNVELKASGVEAAVIEILDRHGLLDRCLLSAFDPASVSNVRLAPHVRAFLLCERWDNTAREDVARSGAQGVCLRDDAATPAAVADIAASGLPLVVWTVDDARRIRALIESNVFALITNHPAMAAEVRMAKKGR